MELPGNAGALLLGIGGGADGLNGGDFPCHCHGFSGGNQNGAIGQEGDHHSGSDIVAPRPVAGDGNQRDTCGANQPQGDGDGGQKAPLPLDHPLQLLRCSPQHLQAAIFPHFSHDGDVKNVVDHDGTDHSNQERRRIDLHPVPQIQIHHAKVAGAVKSPLLRDAHFREELLDVRPELGRLHALTPGKAEPELIGGLVAVRLHGSLRNPDRENTAVVLRLQDACDGIGLLAVPQIQGHRLTDLP